MAFQQTVRYQLAAGLPGEIANDGPLRAETFRLISNEDVPAAPIAFGRAFGYADPALVGNPDGLANVNVAIPGGDNFAGILIHPKEHASYGNTDGPLSAVYSLPDGSWGGLCRMGILYATVTAANAAAGVPGAALGYTTEGAIVAFVGATPAATTLIPGARLLTALGAAPTGGLAKIELTTIALPAAAP